MLLLYNTVLCIHIPCFRRAGPSFSRLFPILLGWDFSDQPHRHDRHATRVSLASARRAARIGAARVPRPHWTFPPQFAADESALWRRERP